MSSSDLPPVRAPQTPTIMAGMMHSMVRQTSPGHYALVLMDMQMPNMDGLEATRELRKMPSAQHLPIIAMSLAEGSGQGRGSGSSGQGNGAASEGQGDAGGYLKGNYEYIKKRIRKYLEYSPQAKRMSGPVRHTRYKWPMYRQSLSLPLCPARNGWAAPPRCWLSASVGLKLSPKHCLPSAGAT